MDEHHPEPVVHAVVRRRVFLHEAREHPLAADDHRAVGHDARRLLRRLVGGLGEAADLRDEGGRVDDARHLHHVRDGAVADGDRRPTHADVALDGERDRQPDGGGVEHGGQEVGQPVVGEAPAVRRPLDVVAERVEVDEGHERQQAREHVRQRHRHQHAVGRRAHVAFEQHDADEDVSDGGE